MRGETEMKRQKYFTPNAAELLFFVVRKGCKRPASPGFFVRRFQRPVIRKIVAFYRWLFCKGFL